MDELSEAIREPRGVAVEGIPGRIRLRVFLRGLLLQASWNPRGMQSLGFAYALWPALEWLYPEGEARARALRRHLGLFNTHPYFAAAILGGALRYEERIARGEESPEAVGRFKEALMFPFAAVGDSFFWLSLRPFAGVVAALTAPWIGLWAVPLFLVLYDLPHLALRSGLFIQGYRSGDDVVNHLASLRLPALGLRLRQVVGILAGVALASAFWKLEALQRELPELGFVGLPLVAAVACWLLTYLLSGRRGSLLAGYLAIALGIICSLVFGPG